MRLNQGRIGNIQTTKAISDILETNPNVEFRLDCPNVTEVEIADHLNGKLCGYDNSPLFALNAIYQKTQYVDVALVQCFFGQDALQEKAIELALKFMSLSNPRPIEWVFVEAQRREEDAKFKWVVGLGCKYVFVKVQNDKQDYFIKEQLWNIGAKNTKSKRLVFVDGDVAYCQMDWLAHVSSKLDKGIEFLCPNTPMDGIDTAATIRSKYDSLELSKFRELVESRNKTLNLWCFNVAKGLELGADK